MVHLRSRRSKIDLRGIAGHLGSRRTDKPNSDLLAANLRIMQAENQRSLGKLRSSLAALKNKKGDFARDHRTLIALREEIAALIGEYE